MDTRNLIETVRQQLEQNEMLNRMLLNLQEAIQNRDNILNSQWYDLFSSNAQRSLDLIGAENLITSCTDTVNRQIRILEMTMVEPLSIAS